jgi:C-3',4' desaturase CrtD
MKKTIVVGAGGGGIASALLASLRGEEVTLLEAHENVGGCASWFDRKDFNFDVGATTLSGLSPGEPLYQLFSRINSFPPVEQIDPGMVIHLSSGKVIHYYSDFEKWMQELEKNFPNLKHRPFWKLVHSLNQKAWGLLENLSAFPFSSPTDLWQILKAPKYFTLYPFLLVSTELILKRYNLDRPEYLELLNGILLISAQTEAPHVPFLIGAMALAYPATTYAPKGGMKGFMQFLESECQKRNIEIKTNAKVQSIYQHEVKLMQETLEAERLILNLTRWDLPELFRHEEKEKLKFEMKQNKEAWGAFTLYFACPKATENLYQQVHLNHPLVKNYFISFSSPADRFRSPEGWQCVTISTHIEAYQWFLMNKEDYKINKTNIQNLILNDFKQRFGVRELKYLTSGTPRTFERYTGRKTGFVGGLPFLYGMNPWNLIGHQTPLNEVYRVGDTTFPGQGIVGVVAGALALDEELKKAP